MLYTYTIFLKLSPMRIYRCFLLSFLLISILRSDSTAQDSLGYRLLANSVFVQGQGDWVEWKSPPGVKVVTKDGWVEPRFLRSEINVARDAERFIYVNPFVSNDTLQGGVSVGGSNVENGANVLDGDMSTYWEPTREDPIDDWFIEVDLGRAVVAHRVILRFVDSGEGDPFLKFRLVGSDGQRFGEEQRRRFYRIGLQTQPNKRQRFYTFELEPQRPVGPKVTGEIMQYLRIDVLDTDGARAEEIDENTFVSLSERERGSIDYFRVTSAGREILVDPKTWELLPEEEKGPIRYYRYEAPRLAEIEVYTLGENIVQLTQSEKELGADESGFDFLFFRIYTDGLYSSAFPMRVYNPVSDENQIELDLGAKYWLNRVKLLMPERPPPAYQIRVSDGTLSANGEQIWSAFPERKNLSGYQHLEESFSTQEVRFIEVRRLEFSRTSEEGDELSEIQAFGEGYVSDLILTSPFIALGQPRLLTSVEWEAEIPPGTRIDLRTRSGEQVQVIPHYYAITGREISKTLWELLPESRRPPIEIEERAGSDWSSWSEIYQAPGGSFKSPNPRPYVQAQLRLVSKEPLRAAKIRSLRLNFEPPLVDKILAEIWPVWGVEPGSEQEFTLYLNPKFAEFNPGFDLLRLRSSSVVPLELLSVRKGTDEALRFGVGETLWPGMLKHTMLEDGTVELRFPEPVFEGNQIFELRFKTKVFVQSTSFVVELESKSRPGRIQQVSPGDASSLVPSQSLVVVSDLGEKGLLRSVRVTPSIITPNGDGSNEFTQIQLSIYHVEGTKKLDVVVYDLSGARKRDLTATRNRLSGELRVDWDGRDDTGRMVRPGIYAIRVEFNADADVENTGAICLVHVVY